jgi:hypothetical protein
VPDWLIAYDDLLTRRLDHCTDCGTPHPPDAWSGVMNLPCGASVAYQVCARCHDTPGGEAALMDRLEHRYRKERIYDQ